MRVDVLLFQYKTIPAIIIIGL